MISSSRRVSSLSPFLRSAVEAEADSDESLGRVLTHSTRCSSTDAKGGRRRAHDGPRPGSLTRRAAARGNGEGNDNCIRRTADVTTRFSHGRFPGWTSAGPASRSSCVIHRALSVCPSGPIYIPSSSKLTFHRREEERRGGRASSRSIIRRTGASGRLGKVLRQLSETQQWVPISTGEQRVCMTLLTMIPPSVWSREEGIKRG